MSKYFIFSLRKGSTTSLPPRAFIRNAGCFLHWSVRPYTTPPFILKAATQGWRINSSTSFKTQSRFFHFSMWMVLSIFSLSKKACYIPMTDSTLSKALYKAQKFGAQYAWQRPRLKGKSREKTWGSWFCWKEIKQRSIFPKFNKRSGVMSMAECVESMRSEFQSLFLQVSTCVIPSSSQNLFCLTFSSVQQDKIYDARTLNTSPILLEVY